MEEVSSPRLTQPTHCFVLFCVQMYHLNTPHTHHCASVVLPTISLTHNAQVSALLVVHTTKTKAMQTHGIIIDKSKKVVLLTR